MKSVEKFIRCLEENLEKIQKDNIIQSKNDMLPTFKEKSQEHIEVANFIRILSTSEKRWKMQCELFTDYDILCKYLKKFSIGDYDKMEIIFYFIQRNFSIGILEKSRIFDSRCISKYTFRTIEKEKIQTMILDSSFRALLLADDANLTMKEKKQKEEILKFTNKKALDAQDIVLQYRTLKESYFDKQDHYNENDIRTVVLVLKTLGVDEDICQSISFFLGRKITKKEEDKNPFYMPIIKSENRKHYITDKEYKEIRKELNCYFDFYHMKEIRKLTFKEALYCISLMLQIECSTKEIQDFLYKTKQETENLYERLRFYGYEHLAIEMEEILCELAICDEKDCAFWSCLLKQKQIEAFQALPYSCKYEIEKAKKCVKKREMSC